MSVQKATDVGGPGGQRTQIPHGNMRAKPLDYIGQVFECKADSLHYYSRKILAWPIVFLSLMWSVYFFGWMRQTRRTQRTRYIRSTCLVRVRHPHVW